MGCSICGCALCESCFRCRMCMPISERCEACQSVRRWERPNSSLLRDFPPPQSQNGSTGKPAMTSSRLKCMKCYQEQPASNMVVGPGVQRYCRQCFALRNMLAFSQVDLDLLGMASPLSSPSNGLVSDAAVSLLSGPGGDAKSETRLVNGGSPPSCNTANLWAAPGSHLRQKPDSGSPNSMEQELWWPPSSSSSLWDNDNGKPQGPAHDLWGTAQTCGSCGLPVELMGETLGCQGCRKPVCQGCHERLSRCQACREGQNIDEQQLNLAMASAMTKTVGGPVHLPRPQPRGLLRLPRPLPLCGHPHARPTRFCDACDILVCESCYRREHQPCADAGLSLGAVGIADGPRETRESRLRLQSRLASINAVRREVGQRHGQEAENVRAFFDRLRRQIGAQEEKMLQLLDSALNLRLENLRAQEAELRRRHGEGPTAEAEAERSDGPGAFQVWEDATVEFLSPPADTGQTDPVATLLSNARLLTSAYVPHCNVICPRDALVFTGKLFAFHVQLRDHLHNPVELRSSARHNPDGTGGLGEMQAWAVVLSRGRPTREIVPASVQAYPTVGHYAVSLQSPRRACELLVHCRLRGQDLPNTPMRWRVEESRDYRRLATAIPIHVVGSGEPSNLPGHFNRPWGIACDDQGYLVISDRANGRIQILRPDFSVERVFGQQGSGDGDLQKPAGVAIHPLNRHIYVVDKDNHRIVVFSWQGEFLFRWGRRGTQRGEFFYPWDLAIDPNGQRLVVTDSRNHRLQFFRCNGDFLGEYQMESVVMNLPPANLAATGRMLDQPRGITFIDQSRLVVTDFQTHRLCVIRLEGSAGQVTYIGGEGTDLGRFVRPQCVASDREGNLVVTESRSGRVQVLDNTMRAQLTFGSPGNEPGQFNRPAGVCFTPQRRLVIVDSENHRVIVYSLD